MRSGRRRVFALVSGLALCSAISTGVVAQDTASEEAGAAGREIVVTAQRREERLVDVPASVVLISGSDLEEKGVQSFDQIGTIAPSLTLSRSGVQPQPAIRGITSRAAGAGADSNVAVYVDGFYMPEPLLLNNDLVNVSNIQVLAGPQGALYGRNATGGALLITTLEPNSERPIVDFDIGFGSRKDVRARAYVATPVTEGLSVGLGGYYRVNDGYLKTTAGTDAAPAKLKTLQAKIKAEPTDDITITLGYNYYYVHDGRGVLFNAVDLWLFGQPIPPEGPEYTSKRDRVSMGPVPADFVARLNEGTFKLEWATDVGKFAVRASHALEKHAVTQDLDFTTRDLVWLIAPSDRKYTTAALDYDGSIAPGLNILAGVQYYKERSRNRDVRVFTFSALSQRLFGVLKTRNISAYLDATWEAADNLFLTVGARQSWERKTVFNSRINGPVGPEEVIAPPTSANFNQFTPRANIRYELSPYSSVYASFTKGFKAGTFNLAGTTLAITTNRVEPETVTAFEVGYKYAQGPLHLELAAYHYDYKNLQVTINVPLGPGGTRVSLVENAASARSYGFEASAAYELAQDLNLWVAAAYTHSRYRKFPEASATILVNGRNVASFIDLSGRRLANSPDFKINGGLDYTLHADEHAIKFSVNGAYTTRYAPTLETYDPVTGKSRFYQEGYFTASASVDWTLPGDQLTIGAFVRNLTDQRYKLNYAASSNGTYSVYNEPRSFGVRFGYEY